MAAPTRLLVGASCVGLVQVVSICVLRHGRTMYTCCRLHAPFFVGHVRYVYFCEQVIKHSPNIYQMPTELLPKALYRPPSLASIPTYHRQPVVVVLACACVRSRQPFGCRQVAPMASSDASSDGCLARPGRSGRSVSDAVVLAGACSY